MVRRKQLRAYNFDRLLIGISKQRSIHIEQECLALLLLRKTAREKCLRLRVVAYHICTNGFFVFVGRYDYQLPFAC